MLRITVISQTREEVVLKAEGWISGEHVHVLEEEGARWLDGTRRLVLDLSGVRFIDNAGIGLLQHWWGDRLVLQGGSKFVHALLEEHDLT